jgi:uncharacterized membrane protein YccC
MPGINQQFLILLFGAVFTALGVTARLGVWKNWYWRSRGTVYGYIPFGLVFILYSFNAVAKAQPPPSYLLFQGAIVLLIACGVWWSVRPPALIKPAWVRWVEAYPQDVREAMAKAVEQGKNWEARVRSKEALAEWASSLGSRKSKSEGRSRQAKETG